MLRSRVFIIFAALMVYACHASNDSAPPPADFSSESSSSSEPSSDVPPPDPPVRSRPQIIESSLTLRVHDGSDAITSIRRAAGDHGGFVESSHERRQDFVAQLVLRIPSTQLEGLMSALRSMGSILDAQQRIMDVGATQVDLAARLRNERAHEARLLTMMNEQAETLDDLLRVSEQLRVVRENIERMEAQTHILDERIAYARVEIKVEPIPHTTTVEEPRARDLLRDAWVAGFAFAYALLLGFARMILFVGPAAILMTAFGTAIHVVWKALRRAFTR